MPPRYAYWTILIDGKATAFRAHTREELLPTFNQLARKNPAILMRYFSRGKLWDSPEQAQWASRNVRPPFEKRGPDWRPGGKHEDPRARFKKKSSARPPADRDRSTPDRKPRFQERDRPFPDRERPFSKFSKEERPKGPRRERRPMTGDKPGAGTRPLRSGRPPRGPRKPR
ncbi:MAG: hypothetical protein LBQ09_06265 [Acidobacteriaceae bacterium]|jgi:hypothetical protein|nr:hypothetical protein [Acidobacteriaceae bacterium]